MSVERIGKLEALLKRVTSRAAEPRAARFVEAAAPAAPPKQDMIDQPTTHPPSTSVAPVTTQTVEMEVELPEPAIELQVEAAAQSDERLIAAKPVAATREREREREREEEEEEEEASAMRAADEAPQIEIGGEMMTEAELDELPEEEAHAPSSSRRPMGPPPGEVLEQRAFGKEETPEPALHTPPPESGKIPAAPELPSIVEMADYDNQDITGVHHTPAGERRGERGDDALAQSGEHRSELAPEVTQAAPKASGPIADVIGTANAFKPTTFGELLDATLKL